MITPKQNFRWHDTFAGPTTFRHPVFAPEPAAARTIHFALNDARIGVGFAFATPLAPATCRLSATRVRCFAARSRTSRQGRSAANAANGVTVRDFQLVRSMPQNTATVPSQRMSCHHLGVKVAVDAKSPDAATAIVCVVSAAHGMLVMAVQLRKVLRPPCLTVPLRRLPRTTCCGALCIPPVDAEGTGQ
ncbi:hypothetical protein FKP32DRAFT_1389524 [Trametes sanguinea]|nr:hypothetical protein FKP32DRAFT_1389524 [Trametes sanguinea]